MPRIALVVLDTLRKDAFEDFFEWIPGTYYPNTYSTANWTLPAHASLFTGYYPTEVSATVKSKSLNTDAPVLAELLRDHGYRTEAYSANPNVATKNGFDRGFDEFVLPSELKNPGAENTMTPEEFSGESDAEGMELYLRALRECVVGDYDTIPSIKLGIGQKFGIRRWQTSVPDSGASTVRDRLAESTPAEDQFTFVNLMEAHTPYDPPPEFAAVDEPVIVTIQDMVEGVDDPDRVRQAYSDAARYLSHVYESMFDVLVEDYDYVITLSDHGEMLGEHGMWNHTYGLYPELTNVPLVITDCDAVPEASVETDPVSFVDVHRTMLDLAGIDAESRGRNILGEFEPTDRLVEFHGLIDDAKEGLRESGIDESRIDEYDRPFRGIVSDANDYYVEGEDPPDTRFPRREERLAALESDLEDRGTGTELADEDSGLEGATKAQLEDLGYM